MMWQSRFILSLFTILAFQPAHATNPMHHDPQIFHVYEDVDMISTSKIEYGKPRIVIRSLYPQLESDDMKEDIESFNTLVDDFVNEKISQFTNEVEASPIYNTDIPRSKIRNDFYLDYATSFIRSGKNSIISVRFITQGYISGNTHPFQRHYVLNFNLHNGEQIDLSSLFKPGSNYLSILSDYSRYILNQRLKDKQLVDKGTSPEIENFKNWNIKPSGLLVTFDENQVAPYIYGAQTVLIPFSMLAEIIEPSSPIMSCIKNKRTCANSSVITGGFIDEAKLSSKKHVVEIASSSRTR